jgi:hypothetical protein
MKKMIFLYAASVLFFLSAFTLKAQIEWQKCLGGSSWDVGRSIRQISDGGYIAAGYAMSIDGDVSGNHGGGVSLNI